MSKKNYIYIGLICLIWLITYIICQFVFEQKLGWDEISYLTCARGIAESLDFSSRSTTIMGLIKYPFPQHTHHYPLLSIYIATFFKLFGISLKAAYFSIWLTCLIACIFIFLTLLLVTENNYLLSFLFSILFLFLPETITYCNSAMMEIPGAALVSFLIYFIFKDIKNNKANPLLFAICGVWLFFYKSLLVGVVLGLITIVFLVFKKKLKLQLLFSGTFILLLSLFSRFIFLPLAPMMNFNPKTEGAEGTYADFLGGFFNDPLGNLKDNLINFYYSVIHWYYPFKTIFYPETDAFFTAVPEWYELMVYFLVVLFIIFFYYTSRKKINDIQKLFIVFSMVSIISMNTIYNMMISSGVGLIVRYNIMYLPLLLISICIILQANYDYVKPFVLDHKIGACFILISFITLVYIPFYYSSNIVFNWNKNVYHDIAHKNSEIVKKFIGNSNPMFVYFTVGTHTTWDSFPTRVILMEATNEQIKKLNLKLSKPIEYLFLNISNNLFKQNQELILKAQPIIDSWYTFYGIDLKNKIVVYKYNPSRTYANSEQWYGTLSERKPKVGR